MRYRIYSFTLIEIVIAMVVLVIGLIGLMRLFPIGLSILSSSELLTKQTILCQNKLEEVKLQGWDGLKTLEGDEEGLHWQISIDGPLFNELVFDDILEDIRYITVRVWPKKDPRKVKEMGILVNR